MGALQLESPVGPFGLRGMPKPQGQHIRCVAACTHVIFECSSLCHASCWAAKWRLMAQALAARLAHRRPGTSFHAGRPCHSCRFDEDGQANVSPGLKVLLRGMPTPKGKHQFFGEDDE